jgi:hypothetical protein
VGRARGANAALAHRFRFRRALLHLHLPGRRLLGHHTALPFTIECGFDLL